MKLEVNEDRLERLSVGYTMDFEKCEIIQYLLTDIRNAYKEGYRRAIIDINRGLI